MIPASRQPNHYHPSVRRQEDQGVWWANPVVAATLSLAPMVLAIFLDAHQLTLHNALKGATFTADGTNLGSALLLSAGRLPYNNFVLTQPPGMSILMLPFAWAAHAASSNGTFTAARIVTAVFAVADVLLVGLVARQRGFAGSIIAGATFALYPFAFHATASAFLEPYLLFFCLFGLYLAFPNGELAEGRRLVTAGVLLGFAITIKPWAVVPAAAVLICSGVRWKEVFARFGAGVLGGVVVPCLFFFVAAPGPFWHDVVVAELGGGTSASAAPSAANRLATLLGIGPPIGIHDGRGLAVGITVVLVLATGLLTLARLKLSLMLDWAIIGTTVVLFIIAFIPHSIPVTYGYFVAAFVAVVLGIAVGNLLSLISSIGTGVGVSAAAGGSIVLVAVAVGLIALVAPKETHYEHAYFAAHGLDPMAHVDSAVPQGLCAISNDPTVLIVSDRLLGQPSSCPAIIDPAGILQASGLSGKAAQAFLVTTWEQAMNSSRYLVINTDASSTPWAPQLNRFIRRNFTLASHGRVEIYSAKVASS